MVATEKFSVLKLSREIKKNISSSWASANIALIKYWGKRDEKLHLPTHGSLSLSLGKLGTRTTLTWDESITFDEISLNNQLLELSSKTYQRTKAYFDLFRPAASGAYRMQSYNSVPTAAGLASSASGYAALAKALDELHGWNLLPKELSIVARLGSGSACRSIFNGFAIWYAGNDSSGNDCFAESLAVHWPDLCWTVACISNEPKNISSREAMRRCQESCPWFSTWIDQSKKMLIPARQAVESYNFTKLGELMENSALSMHGTMMCAQPSIIYWEPSTLNVIQHVMNWRREGLECYFTIDAGPNVKILHRRSDSMRVQEKLDELLVKWLWIDPWENFS